MRAYLKAVSTAMDEDCSEALWSVYWLNIGAFVATLEFSLEILIGSLIGAFVANVLVIPALRPIWIRWRK